MPRPTLTSPSTPRNPEPGGTAHASDAPYPAHPATAVPFRNASRARSARGRLRNHFRRFAMHGHAPPDHPAEPHERQRP